MKTLSVPGNLLLTGEFTVTVPGGTGIAFAINPKVTLTLAPANHFSIECLFGTHQYKWKEGTPFPKELKLLETIIEAFSPKRPSCAVVIDSTPLSYKDGTKKGFGSSAAVTVGLTFLLLSETLGRDPDLERELIPKALNIHRSFQNGKGSGYDILASSYGGVGMITGGVVPKWTPLSLNWTDTLYYVRGDTPCVTKNALKNFTQFKEKHPEKWKHFFETSNLLTEQLIKSDNDEVINEPMDALLMWNQELHTFLGIPSTGPLLLKALEEVHHFGGAGKPVGSGGELAVLWGHQPSQAIPLEISKEGVSWEL